MILYFFILKFYETSWNTLELKNRKRYGKSDLTVQLVPYENLLHLYVDYTFFNSNRLTNKLYICG